jgi:hypothetical protein
MQASFDLAYRPLLPMPKAKLRMREALRQTTNNVLAARLESSIAPTAVGPTFHRRLGTHPAQNKTPGDPIIREFPACSHRIEMITRPQTYGDEYRGRTATGRDRFAAECSLREQRA